MTSATSASKSSVFDPAMLQYFVAGGAAGAASRTVVSPLERLKIIQQVQPKGSAEYKGVWRSLVRMWKEEGFKGYMRGNGINCLRIIPYSAVQFTTYETLKKWFARGGAPLDTPTRLTAGALAGIASVTTTYPLDLVRSRLSLATATISATAPALNSAPAATMTAGTGVAAKAAYHTASSFLPHELTMWGMTKKVFREEGGIKGLYRGLVTTAVGVAPYVGINFAAYEAFRGIITPPGKTSVPRKLLCGALAGSMSQTLTYPVDVLRRRMQVTGMKAGMYGPRYNNAYEAVKGIVAAEGWKGLYRGLWPNLLKVAPSIATSFFTYELVKELLQSP